MKNKLKLICTILVFCNAVTAFTEISVVTEPGSAPVPANANHANFGLEISDRAGCLGTGLHITSPYFFYGYAAIRLRGELVFDNREWSNLWVIKAGLIGVSGFSGSNIRLYGEGGVVFVIPSQTVTTTQFAFGGYGHFGFEFFFNPADETHSAYFIELGATGVQLRADKLPDSPALLNGFATTAGLRFYY